MAETNEKCQAGCPHPREAHVAPKSGSEWCRACHDDRRPLSVAVHSFETLASLRARIAELESQTWGHCLHHRERWQELSRHVADRDIEDDPCVGCAYINAIRYLDALRVAVLDGHHTDCNPIDVLKEEREGAVRESGIAYARIAELEQKLNENSGPQLGNVASALGTWDCKFNADAIDCGHSYCREHALVDRLAIANSERLTDEALQHVAWELAAWLAPGQFIQETIERAIRAARSAKEKA